MEIVLGYELDAGGYPDALKGKEATEGVSVLGPERLVEILETRLGLSAPQSHPAVRIGHYLNCMKLTDNGNRFYSRSFASDAWSTAKAVLAWRDELRLGGWKAQELGRPGTRLQDMYEVERKASWEFAPGLGDRLQAIGVALKAKPRLDIRKIRLVEGMELWPPCWKALLKKLQAQRVTLQEDALSDLNGGVSSLSLLQEALRRRTPSQTPWNSDGTLGVLRANTEWEAAEALSTWLNTFSEEELRGVLFIRGQGSPLLDDVFQSRGLPSPGRDSRARWRAALQLLPLVLSQLWAPFDPYRLLELLTLRRLPFSSNAAYEMERALRTHPGKGGPEWNKAMANGLRMEPDLGLWLGNHSCDPRMGANTAEILNLCDRVSTWAAKRGGESSDPLLLAVSEIVKSVAEAVLAAGLPSLTPSQLARILDSTVGEGIENPQAYTQAAPWSQVASPGQIYGQARTIIWWNFMRPGNGSSRPPWTRGELALLEASGVQLEAPSMPRRREVEAWRRPVLFAQSRLFFVVPGALDGDTRMHPLWDEIRYLLNLKEPDISRITVDPAALRQTATPQIFGNTLHQEPVPATSLPMSCRQWPIPHPHLCSRADESFSSMERLIQCPFAWILHYILGIRPGNLISLPDEGQMVGTLAHSIVETLFKNSGTWGAAAARKQAEKLYDAMVPEMAASLLLPGQELERLRYRKEIAEGVERLVNFLNSAKLVVVGSEVPVSKPFTPATESSAPYSASATSKSFNGRIDLILTHKNPSSTPLTTLEAALSPGGSSPLFFIDLKWTRSAKYRRKEMEEGKPLQLAVYSWLLSSNARSFPPGGFYLLPWGDALFAPCSSIPATIPNPTLALSKVWTDAVAAYNLRLSQISNGVAYAEGVDGTTSAPAGAPANISLDGQGLAEFRLEAPCKWCDFTNLCGREEE